MTLSLLGEYQASNRSPNRDLTALQLTPVHEEVATLSSDASLDSHGHAGIEGFEMLMAVRYSLLTLASYPHAMI